MAYLIAGHHTGLPDWNHVMDIGGALEPKLREKEHLKDAMLGNPPREFLEASLPVSICQAQDLKYLHLWIRVLFSCLVDADFLDTERYMDQKKNRGRLTVSGLPELEQLKVNFDLYMAQKGDRSSPTDVNLLRKEILTQCREHAEWAPGIFSLTVPTGGGKTLSGMAFALDHALRHKKNRIIVAIPYTSIIEQTAKQYREVFGDDAVLEHHSNLDPDKETEASRLASENWDAPIIVTTNVQFFESLYAARTSACRKLHNIVNSVIILDEAQMLPPEFLQPIVSSIKALTEMFGCSVVLSTATQPALARKIQSGKAVLDGFEPETVRELMSEPADLARRLRRVKIEQFISANDRSTWSEIAQALEAEERVLCIVNTRKDCRAVYDLLPKGTVHLSALMCPEHRTVVIAQIKTRLQRNGPLRVISTQLVEAGVDIDFPVVYRAMAGFDSIAQAAGRCNREGKLNALGKIGRTVVFNPPKPAPPGTLLKGQQSGEEILRLYPDLAAQLDPEIFSHYFQTFYQKVNSFDEKGILRLLAGPDVVEAKIQFRTAASRFSLIENAGQVPVVTWYTRPAKGDEPELSGKTLVEELEKYKPNRKLMRRIQRFTVTVPQHVVDNLVNLQLLRPIQGMEGLWTQTEMVTHGEELNLYDSIFGLRLEGPGLSSEDFIS